MKLRSRGLGRKELVMDFREYDIARDGDDVVVSGTIREPVNWDFTIRINGDDIPGMLRLGLHRQTLALAFRWVFHRHADAPPAAITPRAADRPELSERPERHAVSPRAASPRAVTRTVPVVSNPPISVERTPVRVERGPAPVKTPDFGTPRRRGTANGAAAPAIAERTRP